MHTVPPPTKSQNAITNIAAVHCSTKNPKQSLEKLEVNINLFKTKFNFSYKLHQDTLDFILEGKWVIIRMYSKLNQSCGQKLMPEYK